MATQLLGIDEITSSQSQKYVTHNDALHHLEVHITGVKDRNAGGPSTAVANGEAFIVDSTTGGWSTATLDDVAYYYDSAWHFYTPVEGICLHVHDEERDYKFDGSDWVPAHRESGIALISRTTAVGVQNGDGKTTLFTVPTGKKFIPTMAVIRAASGDLAEAVDVSFGDDSSAVNWKRTIDISAMTTASETMVISAPATKFVICDAADTFGFKPQTGSTADETVIIETFGFLYDA